MHVIGKMDEYGPALNYYKRIVFLLFRGAEWEETFLEEVGKAEDGGLFKHITVARFASRTLDHELERNTRTVVPYFGSTFLLMALFR